MLKHFTIITILAIAVLGCANKNKTMQNKISDDKAMYMILGTYTSDDSNGLYVYKIDTVTGKSEYISETPVANPSYLALDESENYVYAVTEDDGIETSAANAFSFDKKTGTLKYINKQLTKGAAPCYINVDKEGRHVITANYSGGNLSVFKVSNDGGLNPVTQVIGFDGTGFDPERQEQPHIHCVKYSPDEKYLFATDLGLDKIHKFEVLKDTQDTVHLKHGNPEAYDLKAGSGPRHLVFHPNNKYAYLITELSGEVVVYNYDDGNLEEIQVIEADSLNAQGSADIHVSPDGKFVYASNRLQADGIAIFSVDLSNGRLTKVGYHKTGEHPRNFAITPNGNLLLVANRDSNQIQVLKRNTETGLLEDTGNDINLSKPVCIKFASIN